MLRLQPTVNALRFSAREQPEKNIALMRKNLNPGETWEAAAQRLAIEGRKRVLKASELTIVMDYHPHAQAVSQKLLQPLSG
jgi:precorrin-6x reductase